MQVINIRPALAREYHFTPVPPFVINLNVSASRHDVAALVECVYRAPLHAQRYAIRLARALLPSKCHEYNSWM